MRCVVNERQRNELHQRHEVARMNQRNVENQDKDPVVRVVDARDLHLVQVGRAVDVVDVAVFFCDLFCVLDHLSHRLDMNGSWCQSMSHS